MRFLLHFFGVLALTLSVHSNAYSQTYKWSSVAMGGGGFVTGLALSKAQQNLVYARTDVGGAYRWDAVNSVWIPLLDWVSENETSYMGVESFALDPQAPNKLYMLAGTSYWNGGKTAILRSTDYGNTFTVTDVTGQFKASGNGAGRSNGEKLVVDPNNGNILFCGTRRNGLFKSTDAGATWVQNAALGSIVTPNDNGISFVMFDSASGTTGSATPNIFVGISTTTATNFYYSTDAGATFNALAGAPAALMPQRAVIASNRNMYITYGDKEGPANATTGQVWKYNIPTPSWTDITPSGAGYGYSGVSVDPGNPNKIIIGTINKYLLQYGPASGGAYGDRFYLSTDGGNSWRNLVGSGIVLDPNGSTWIYGQAIHWGGNIEFNPFNSNEAWVNSGNGIFVCNDLNAAVTTWKFVVKGLEETVPKDAVSIAGGAFFSAILDYDGFRHTDVTQYPAVYNPRMGAFSNSIAYAGINTSKMLRIGTKMYYSDDQGLNWTAATLPTAANSGRVTITADGNAFLYCPSASSITYRSVDNGATWTASTGLAISNAVPVADMVNPNKIYAYNNTSGNIWISTDAGVSFSSGAFVGTGTNNSKIIRTVPGQEGHIWIPVGSGGLKRSVNAGTSFTTIAGVTSCTAVGFGKADAGAAYPAIYIWGTIAGITGVYRSVNEGANWIRINDDAHEYGGLANGQFVMGDMNVFGRVYMSTAGRGIAYGELNASLPVKLVSFYGALSQKSQAILQWKTATEINNNYFEVERSVDGISFIKLAVVSTQAFDGNSSFPLNYRYTDEVGNLNGTLYYRLKQVDKDGKYFYSNIVAIKINNTGIDAVQTFPNPSAANNINLKIQLTTARKLTIQVLNASGSLLYKGKGMALTAGTHLLKLPGTAIKNKGTYILALMNESDDLVIAHSKMIVQ